VLQTMAAVDVDVAWGLQAESSAVTTVGSMSRTLERGEVWVEEPVQVHQVSGIGTRTVLPSLLQAATAAPKGQRLAGLPVPSSSSSTAASHISDLASDLGGAAAALQDAGRMGMHTSASPIIGVSGDSAHLSTMMTGAAAAVGAMAPDQEPPTATTASSVATSEQDLLELCLSGPRLPHATVGCRPGNDRTPFPM
jgi:hypothetical protein